MTTDTSATKDRLLRAGTLLFAARGVDRVTVGEIHRAAGQRNASALHYHFGSREGLLSAILEHHAAQIERLRRVMLDELVADAHTDDLRAIAATLVVPQSSQLATKEGRAFLRILEQIVHRIGIREEHLEATEPVPRILALANACLTHVPPPLRRERTTVTMHVIAMTLGERARQIDESEQPVLADEEFVENLVEMVVAGLQAPVPALLARSARV